LVQKEEYKKVPAHVLLQTKGKKESLGPLKLRTGRFGRITEPNN